MYSRRINGFDADQQAEGLALAANVAIALVAAQEVEHLNSALISRTVIGQAQGILMERFGIDAARVFGLLRRVSQQRNIKLQQIAAELIQTRKTPGA